MHRRRLALRDNALFCYVRAHLRRRLFVAFAGAILLSGLASGAVIAALHQKPSWRVQLDRVERFAAGRFADTWSDPARRDALARTLARDLDADVTVFDEHGRALATETPSGPRATPACERPAVTLDVRGERATVLGAVRVCTLRMHVGGGWRPLVGLGAAVLVLWALAGVVSRRLTRPLDELVRVVQDIGRGKLASRMDLGRHDARELDAIALAVNDMAARIERQIEDQRDLLAAVSHEIRSPLARMRFVVESLRDDDPVRSANLDALDRELTGVDALVGDLLASSRMDFGALRAVRLDPSEVAARALERAGLAATLCVLEGAPAPFMGDATLVHTALANLLTNAARHGGRCVALRVSREGEATRFAVDDDGAGFAPGDLERAFEPFYRAEGARREGRPGVGLGLALVRRVAEVHGGRAWVENLPNGGARVGLTLVGIAQPPR
jgi:signal transduction histidine kinase